MAGDDAPYEQHSSQALSSRPGAADSGSKSGRTECHRWAGCHDPLYQSPHGHSHQTTRMAQENLEVARTFSFPRERPEQRCLDGRGEAQLIHLACSQAPGGRQRWTLELLADQMVRLGYVEHSSPETVRTTLKKTRLLPWLKKSWCFPKEADGEFVYHMEDVLDV